MGQFLFLVFFLLLPCLGWSQEGYKRAVETKENVKNKKYTKAGKIEVEVPELGWIINQSFITTYTVGLGLTYFTSENWGFNLQGIMGITTDETERTCLETFYNDPKGEMSKPCGEADEAPIQEGKNVNYGPAYMPTRQIDNGFMANLIWNPVYGKQLFFLSATSYFDFYLLTGIGAIMTTFYPKSTVLQDGAERKSRAQCQQSEDDPNGDCTFDGGAKPSESDLYGKAGRPDPTKETLPVINLGIGQKYHFLGHYSLKVELRNMIVLGTESGFENLISVVTGLNVRF